MHTGRCFDDMADLARLQCECGILEFLLHIAFAKEAPVRFVSIRVTVAEKDRDLQVTSLPRATAVTLGGG